MAFPLKRIVSGRQLSTSSRIEAGKARPIQTLFKKDNMGSEVMSSRAGFGLSVMVGERVTLDGRDCEFVVVNVDAMCGRVELLQLKPGRMESDIPYSALTAKKQRGPRLVGSNSED